MHQQTTYCNFSVTIQDIEAPIINCPNSYNHILINNETNYTYSYTFDAIDECQFNTNIQ